MTIIFLLCRHILLFTATYELHDMKDEQHDMTAHGCTGIKNYKSKD